MVLAHHCRVRVECLGFRATHCLEWLWSRLTRASRCGPRASASSGLTAGGKCALSTWSQLSIVNCCIHPIICQYQKSLWHAFKATTSLTERKRKRKKGIGPDCRLVLSYATDCMPGRQARGKPGFRQSHRQTSCAHAHLLTSYSATLASWSNTLNSKRYNFQQI